MHLSFIGIGSKTKKNCMGDNSIQEAIGKGCIDNSMTIKNNVLLKVLTNLLHVPEFAKNMFSFSKATSHGHIFKFGNKECIIC
jgi:hypothetical protein